MTSHKNERPHNKRSGIFYGSADGHPIIWNNDWNSLIQKEVLARDTFSRKYMEGTLEIENPTFVNKKRGESREWRSTYTDLGEWGPKTFRRFVPHKVSKTDVELPSIPPSRAGSEAMSEYAYRHAKFQLGCNLTEPYLRKPKEKAIQVGDPQGGGKQGGGTDKAAPRAHRKPEISAEDRQQMKQLLATCLLTQSKRAKTKAEVWSAYKRSLANDPDRAYPSARSQRSRAASAPPGMGDEIVPDAAQWKSVYSDLGKWGKDTERAFRTLKIKKTDIEQGSSTDINRPVYPSSPKPHTGAKHWHSDYHSLGNWDKETFLRWIPHKVQKDEVEVGDVDAIVMNFPTPKYPVKDALKTTSLEGPRSIF